MTQAQRTQAGANSMVPAAVAGLVMAAALAGAILVNGFPTINLAPGTGTTNPLIKAEEAWMQQQIAQSAAFDVMNSANRASSDQWQHIQGLLAVRNAGRSSSLLEAERQAMLRHQLMLPESAGLSTFDAAQKVQVERQLQLAQLTREFTGQRKGGPVGPWSDDDVRTPTHPQLR